MIEAARSSETLVNFYQTTRRYNPEDSYLQLYSVLRQRINVMRFHAFTAVKMRIVVFCEYSWIRMEAIRSSETLVTTYKTTRLHNLKDYNNPLSISCFSCVITFISNHIQILNNNNNKNSYNYNFIQRILPSPRYISLRYRVFTAGKC
jgi:hypothetical protein